MNFVLDACAMIAFLVQKSEEMSSETYCPTRPTNALHTP